MVGEVEVRAINEDARTVDFVAATERGVDTWGGKEYLRMSGARLQRYRKNPVVLDAHNWDSTGAVIGKADVKVEGKALVASVTFAATARAEEAWQLVKGGFLRALSVGFMPDSSKTNILADGETDGEDENMITGPARIIKQWELYEISGVPVPADGDALRRTLGDHGAAIVGLSHIIERLGGAEKEPVMAEEKTKPVEAAPENKGEAVVAREPENALMVDRAAAIRAIAPAAQKDLAERCILEGLSVEDSRKRMLATLGEATKPVGSTEPEVTAQGAPAKTQTRKLADMSAEEFKRELIG